VAKDDGESIWIGPIGPIPIVADADPKLVAGRESARVAQAAIDCVDLIELVLHHPDPIVRMEAVPRLKARFPNDTSSQHALIHALKDEDEGVRCAAASAVAELAVPGAGDLLATMLSDQEPDVRFFAAIGLQTLDDPRAPSDPESFACRGTDG
jgi:HEAT repeat protein